MITQTHIRQKKKQRHNLQVVACWSCATRSKATKAMLGNTLTMVMLGNTTNAMLGNTTSGGGRTFENARV